MSRETASAHTENVPTVTATSQEEWEELCSRAFVPLRITAGEPHFLATMDHRVADSVSFTRIRATVRHAGGEVHRTAALVEEDDLDMALFSLQLSGATTVEQRGRSATVGAAHGALYLADEPYRLGVPVTIDSLIVKVPTALLGLERSALAGLSARRLSTRVLPALSLLRRLAGSHVADRPLIANPSETARVCLELLTASLRGAAGATVPARSHESIRAAVRARISQRLADPGLGVRELAASERVSVRTLHAVFGEEDSSPTREIRALRMQRAQHLLRETNLPIAEVAIACGFEEPTSFTRAFRAWTDQSPRQFRVATRTR